ncbi:hypothetical protein D0U04_14625 [Bacillus clarus]|uniref:Putative regulator of sigmaO n=1 Tax=Bacillus clarus TaxID=2338372 RepID=A0A090YZE7_9BACI|nr:hypothetical protein [Bacillus clarus]KFN03478.1 putative regulator of sigmaO [Bacillus clarus]RFT66220.1 hypothetical protein D0U04_14625 [Bacillus clarus]
MGLIFEEDELIDSKPIEEIIDEFSSLIKRKLRNTSFQEREDLEQELKIKIWDKVNILMEQEVPGFWEFVEQFYEDR